MKQNLNNLPSNNRLHTDAAGAAGELGDSYINFPLPTLVSLHYAASGAGEAER
jgi:hypothetical protein